MKYDSHGQVCTLSEGDLRNKRHKGAPVECAPTLRFGVMEVFNSVYELIMDDIRVQLAFRFSPV